ncbi:MAG: hypothetical protein ACTS5I_08615, partial [Rhodanobacter sp.]
MPLPPQPPTARQPADRPSRVLLGSPLAAAARRRERRRPTRDKVELRWPRVLGVVGTILLHLVFLLVFVLGPAYEAPAPLKAHESLLKIRLIDAPEPPPPPLVRGELPKTMGLRQQARTRPATPSPSSVPVREKAAPSVSEVAVQTAKPVAAPRSASVPKPAPTPDLQPVPLTGEPPEVTAPVVALQIPVPPSFQPEPVRPAQLEGTRAMPPPASLALPELPAQAPPALATPTLAMKIHVAKPDAPISVQPARPVVAAAPPVPELQAVPLPAQSAPEVKLHTAVSVAAPDLPRESPRLQAPSIELAETPLEAVPATTLSKPTIERPALAALKVDSTDRAQKTIEPVTLT